MRYRVVRTIVMEGDLEWLEQTLANSETRVRNLDRELGREGRRIYELSCVGPQPIDEMEGA